jgi:hypothetical protein
MMVSYNKYCWIYGLFVSTGALKITRHMKNMIFSHYKVKRYGITTRLDSLEKANLSHWTAVASQLTLFKSVTSGFVNGR